MFLYNELQKKQIVPSSREPLPEHVLREAENSLTLLNTKRALDEIGCYFNDIGIATALSRGTTFPQLGAVTLNRLSELESETFSLPFPKFYSLKDIVDDKTENELTYLKENHILKPHEFIYPVIALPSTPFYQKVHNTDKLMRESGINLIDGLGGLVIGNIADITFGHGTLAFLSGVLSTKILRQVYSSVVPKTRINPFREMRENFQNALEFLDQISHQVVTLAAMLNLN